MADNETEENKPAEAEGAPAEGQEAGMSGDQSFAYWITMLPFIAIAGVFLFEFSKTPGEMTKLINAGGAIVVGIFAASFVNALTGDKSGDEAASADEAKPEGSS